MNLVELNRIAERDAERHGFQHAQGGRKLNVNEAALRRADRHDRHDRIVAGFGQLFGFTHAEIWADHEQLMTPKVTLERIPRRHLSIRLATAAGATSLEEVTSHFFRNGREIGRPESYAAPLVATVTRSRSGGFYDYCRTQRDEKPVDFAARMIEEADKAITAAEETQAMVWDALKDEYLNPTFARQAQEITPVIAITDLKGV